MKKLTVSTLLAGSLVSIAFMAPVSSVSAAPYFACGSGYTLQIQGNAVRCHQPGAKVYAPLKKCGSIRIPVLRKRIGFFLKIDYHGRRDVCVGTYKVAGIRQTTEHKAKCPGGFTKEVKAGRDRCSKRRNPKNIPPTKPVNR